MPVNKNIHTTKLNNCDLRIQNNLQFAEKYLPCLLEWCSMIYHNDLASVKCQFNLGIAQKYFLDLSSFFIERYFY